MGVGPADTELALIGRASGRAALYTHRGDKGDTDLIGGTRVSKDDLRVEACGTIDELNSVIGEVVSGSNEADLIGPLKEVQRFLFMAGADAAADLKVPQIPRISTGETAKVEGLNKELLSRLPALRNFILPGGSPAGARLHVASTVCRRAERRLVAASKAHKMNPELIRFFNALSKYLFNLAREANRLAGKKEETWKS
jgi:cob(I)alamin adenosyltransferase